MTRLIDADALGTDFCDGKGCNTCTGKNKICIYEVEYSMKDVFLWLEQQPTIDAVPRWIPCEERLPENSNTVLITKKSVFGNDNVVCFGWYIGDNHWAIINYKEPDVIAWMPLPKPYAERRRHETDRR